MKRIPVFALLALLFVACSQAHPQGAPIHALQAGPTYRLPPIMGVRFDWQIGAQDSQIREAGFNVLDVDGWNTSAGTVARLHSKGVYAICYLNVGSWEADRPDSASYPAYLRLQKDPDWPEYFLDVRDVWKPNSVLARILNARFAMCAKKGFDAVEPDNLQNAENATGSGLTMADQFNFDGWVADHVHAAGMAVLQKNDPDKTLAKVPTGPSAGLVLADVFDGILNEQCQQYRECSGLTAYTLRDKLAIDVEYQPKKALNCTQAAQFGIVTISRDVNLTAPGTRAYRRTSCP